MKTSTLLTYTLLFFSISVFAQSEDPIPIRQASFDCNNWLYLPTHPSYVNVGQINITGDQMTIEAVFTRTTAYDHYLYAGDLVSKHESVNDVNYLLRPYNAEITTTNGYFSTPKTCDIELNKTYHVALVYNGTSLKFYRNGFLLSEVPATGNLVTNNWATRIGLYERDNYPENLIGYINHVRIWNVARTQAQIRANMEGPLASPTSEPGLLANYVFNDLKNKQGNPAYDGTLSASARINSTNPYCTYVADSCKILSDNCTIEGVDFDYSFESCDPFTVHFSGRGQNEMPHWDFGDAGSSASLAPTHTFSTAGSFTIQYQVKVGDCIDTITKDIAIGVNDEDAIITNDTTICGVGAVELKAKDAASYCWSPASGLDDPNAASPLASPNITTTYTLLSLTKGANLVKNGDFENGNVDFTSSYRYSSDGFPEAVYYVDRSPYPWHPSMPRCTDHTTGTGKMLLVNGAPDDNRVVWQQTITVTPHTTYDFSAWLEHITTINPARLQFSINGVPLGEILQASSVSCEWRNFHMSWNSGSVTAATIAIINKNTEISGNDFALDDISFSAVHFARESVTIKVDTSKVRAGADMLVCRNADVNLAASGAQTYEWTPSDLLNDNQSATPIGHINDETTFLVTGQSLLGCTTVDSTTVRLKNNFYDFEIIRDRCDPLLLTFKSAGSVAPQFSWDFGDGTVGNGSPVSHSYADTGSYLVQYITDDNICKDSFAKVLSVHILNGDIVNSREVHICPGDSYQIKTADALSYCWTPATGLDNPFAASPVATINSDMTYQVQALREGKNLIKNPGFEEGNTGFTSSYNYASVNITEGQYFVGPSPNAWNPSLAACVDHTSGSGKMLLVNGAPTPDINVWTQAISIEPNTDYAFSCWVQALWPPNPAKLQFSINGVQLGDLIEAELPTCTWRRFYAVWNSGNLNSAVIEILNKNTAVIGNDFALDDLSFAAIRYEQDSVFIKIDSVLVSAGRDTTICAGNELSLLAAGADTYSWTPSAGMSYPNSPAPFVSPLTTTQYVVEGRNSIGCTAKDSVTVFVNPSPGLVASGDTTVCEPSTIQLRADSPDNVSFLWTGGQVSNPAAPNTISNVSQSSDFIITVTDAKGCTASDSVVVTVKPYPVFKLEGNPSVCLGDTGYILGSGADIYSWISPDWVVGNTSFELFAQPVEKTTFSVLMTDTVCRISETLQHTIDVKELPKLTVTSSNDVDCTVGSSQLQVTGAVRYVWDAQVAGLSNYNTSRPLAFPRQTSIYLVTGWGSNGCHAEDSVLVKVSNDGKSGFYIPSGFTPNADGLNDCFSVRQWVRLDNFRMEIYNRWGEKVFQTTDPQACWDGTVKGQLQPTGVFVYQIFAESPCANGKIYRKGTVTLIR